MKTNCQNLIVINDKKPNLKPFYYTLACGLQNNQLELVELALQNKVDVSKLYLPTEKLDCDFTEMDKNSEFDLSPALDFARENCLPAIFKAMMETAKLTDDQKCAIVLKTLAEVSTKEDISTNKSLQETLNKYINAKNINQYFKVQSLEDPTSLTKSWSHYENCEATFLHVAVYTKNVGLINKLISMGADVNLKLKKANSETAAHLVVDRTPRTGDQSDSVNALIALINAGINLELKNTDKTSGWEAIVSSFKIPELRKIFANHQPTNLATIEMIKSKSRPLLQFWEKQTKGQGFAKYPLINDVFKYEKRRIALDRNVGNVDKLEQFLKHKSLKKALDQRYGMSSSRLTSAITKNLFDKSQEDLVIVKPKILQVADWLKKIFTEDNQVNISDYLEVLESYSNDEPRYTALQSVTEELHNNYRTNHKSIPNFKKILKIFYTPAQIKAVLMDKNEFEDYIDDISDMYLKFPKELELSIKRTKFSEIDNLQKLHDFLSGEVEALEQADFPLNQEAVNPQLKELKNVKMTLGYGVKLAESNHELIRWGSQMGHCVGGGDYADEAKKGETIILAITKDSEPKYCIEISPKGEIRQVQGKSRAVPEPAVMDEFVRELKKQKIINKTQKASDWK